jgi:hypothetical protein
MLPYLFDCVNPALSFYNYTLSVTAINNSKLAINLVAQIIVIDLKYSLTY